MWTLTFFTNKNRQPTIPLPVLFRFNNNNSNIIWYVLILVLYLSLVKKKCKIRFLSKWLNTILNGTIMDYGKGILQEFDIYNSLVDLL